MAICVQCEYHLGNSQVTCSNENLPITDFVYGIRRCDIFNAKGQCMGFKRKGECESIFETKADEDLAKTE